MSILLRELATEFFPDLLASLHAARGMEPVWRVVEYNFPFVAIQVYRDDGQPLIGLVLDARDWPHRPFSVRPTTEDFGKRLSAGEVPRLKDEHGEVHIYDGNEEPEQGAFFCVEGTREYHEDHGDIVPWESVRHLDEYSPVSVINKCIELLERRPSKR